MKRIVMMPVLMLLGTPACAEDSPEAIRDEIRRVMTAYESRISELEARLAQTEAVLKQTDARVEQAVSTAAGNTPGRADGFNPEISLVLSGTATYLQHNPDRYQIAGFIPSGDEVAPGPRNFSLGESMLSFNSDVGRAFHGKLSLSLAPDNSVSLENAYIQSRHAGDGISYTAGRFFSGIGYMNQQCLDDWDFTDTALPYKAFLGNQYKQDGVQVKWGMSPANMSVEWGVELGRGRGFPVAEENDGIAGALYAHVSGNAGISSSWRAGLSYLGVDPKERSYEDTDALGAPTRNGFSGKSRLWIADFVWKWAPDGNSAVSNFKLQGEYFHRNEAGTLSCAGGNCAAGVSDHYQTAQSGWYLQGIYQFMPAWRVGWRHDRLNSGSLRLGAALNPDDLPVLGAYTPRRNTLMVDYSPGASSRIRLQFTRDESRRDVTDNQLTLQYIVRLGGGHDEHE
ncbi:MAG: hypothetical protein IV089_11550 [Thiobacillus sp.]|nr:hypothetical protein [Thiobacillus sp.]